MSDSKTIMIIDDEKPLANLISELLKGKGYKTVMAHNGLEGLERLKKVQPNLILLDLIMPEMGGIEFYQRICGQNSRSKYPVVIFTARADMESTFKDINVDSFVAKHAEAAKLFEEIENVLHRRRIEDEKVKQYNINQKRRILLVDDNQKSLGRITMALSSGGYKVDAVESELQVIKHLNENSPDVVMMRLQSNDTAGDLFILRLREMYKMKNVKGILFYTNETAYIVEEISKQLSKKSGIVGLLKYVDPDDFLIKVNEVFNYMELPQN